MTSTILITRLATSELLPADFRLSWGGRFGLATGLHKLLQGVIYLLATRQGSIAAMPEFGNNVLDKLQQVATSELSAIEGLLADLASQIEQQYRNIQQDLPADERLGDLSLSLESVTENSIVVLVDVTSQAGQQARYDYTIVTRGLG